MFVCMRVCVWSVHAKRIFVAFGSDTQDHFWYFFFFFVFSGFSLIERVQNEFCYNPTVWERPGFPENHAMHAFYDEWDFCVFCVWVFVVWHWCMNQFMDWSVSVFHRRLYVDSQVTCSMEFGILCMICMLYSDRNDLEKSKREREGESETYDRGLPWTQGTYIHTYWLWSKHNNNINAHRAPVEVIKFA